MNQRTWKFDTFFLVIYTWRLQALQVWTSVEIETESIHAFMCSQGQITDMDSTRTSFYLIWIITMDPTKVCVCLEMCVCPSHVDFECDFQKKMIFVN